MADALKEELIGEWRGELSGTDLLYLKRTDERFRLLIALRLDGTASWSHTQGEIPRGEQSPFPETWEVSDDRVLSIWVPIAPDPDPKYERPDWTREQVSYDVLAVSGISLALSNRRFDGEHVYVLRRVNAEEYERRQVERRGGTGNGP